MIKKKEIPQWKIDEVNQLVELFKQNKCIAVIEVAKINDVQIQSLRKTLRGKAIVKMSKKNLQLRAVAKYKDDSKKENLDFLMENIPGQSSLVFTNMNAFELKTLFEENKWMVPAKPNEITPVDIWVPEGDTGLPTGQVISELNMTLRLPTRIQNDTIWIREDTMTHEAGKFVDVKQAAVLKKLGITPLESLVKIHFAWVDGDVISSDVLYMDIEEFQQQIASCYLGAQKLAVEMGIIDDETIEPMIQKAYREALALLLEMPIYVEEMMDEYIRRAVKNAKMINAIVLGEGLAVPVAKKDVSKKGTKDDKEKTSGIGGLFGGADKDDDDSEPTGIGGLF